jgi:hypothetical protein
MVAVVILPPLKKPPGLMIAYEEPSVMENGVGSVSTRYTRPQKHKYQLRECACIKQNMWSDPRRC